MKSRLDKIGNNFKCIRKKNGYTQKQVADFLDIDRTYLSKFESGERKIGVAKLEKACTLFGCSLKELEECNISNYNPLATSVDSKKLTTEDLNSISEISKIALNLRKMKTIEKTHESVCTSQQLGN